MADSADSPSSAFDPTPYVRAPIFDVAHGVALAIKLLEGIPTPAPDGIRKAARKLRNRTVSLQKAWAESDQSRPASQRPHDQSMDVAWRALSDRLGAYASLPVPEYPRSARAREIIGILFPQGLAFLNLDHEAELAESQKRLDSIATRGLAPDVDGLAGSEFLAEVRRIHRLCSEALRQPTTPTSPGSDLAEPLRSLSRAVVAYAVQVVGLVYDDADAIPRVREALAPIDEYRQRLAGRGPTDTVVDAPVEPLATPTSPVPEISGAS